MPPSTKAASQQFSFWENGHVGAAFSREWPNASRISLVESPANQTPISWQLDPVAVSQGLGRNQDNGIAALEAPCDLSLIVVHDTQGYAGECGPAGFYGEDLPLIASPPEQGIPGDLSAGSMGWAAICVLT